MTDNPFKIAIVIALLFAIELVCRAMLARMPKHPKSKVAKP